MISLIIYVFITISLRNASNKLIIILKEKIGCSTQCHEEEKNARVLQVAQIYDLNGKLNHTYDYVSDCYCYCYFGGVLSSHLGT